MTYEEDNATTTAYKFPINRQRPGEWLQALPRTWYRVVGTRVQVFYHDESADATLVGEVEEFLRGLSPIQDAYVLEIEIGHDDSGFFVQEVGFDDESYAVHLESLTRTNLQEALRQLSPD